ncbi:MAG TPA: hypothetical protein VKR56_07865 [Candidatus Cybelea sp.]|nr:hypothetical protein [Candidatus Cybelea sp.]
MPLFPPVPVAILVDGRPLASYVRAYVAGGRVFAPVAPLITRLADRVWLEGDTLVIQRGAKRVRVRLAQTVPDQFDGAYVAVAPVLRALGASLCWEPKRRRLIVRLPERGTVATPTPFDPAVPSVPPATVFTPSPPVTPRPLWTGSPLPRRTPLALPSPRAE